MAIAQLAIEYCNALVDDSSKRTVYWPQFSFSSDVDEAFNASGRRAALAPLVERVLMPDSDPESDGDALDTQPETSDFEGELNGLIDELINCRQGQPPYAEGTPRGTQYCSGNRTEVVMKAVCAAAIGNAAVLVQ